MKVAMDVRVSTQRQALTQTIEQQLHLLREHSQMHGWPWQEECIFRDDGVSRSQFASAWIGSLTRAGSLCQL